MSSVVAVGIGVAAAAFFVKLIQAFMTKPERSDSLHTGPCRASSFPQISRKCNGCRSIGENILQRWLRAKDEPERSFIDIAAEVNGY